MKKIGKILFTEEQLRQRAKEIGQQIAKDYEGEELVVICTLRGAIMWMADMMKEIPNEMVIDFMTASSYGSNTTSTGVVNIKKDIETDIFKKHVLIIEDIVDTGYTLTYLKQYLQQRGPKSIKICTMLDKPSRRVVDLKADYIGFEIENIFIVGYGLDYDQKYRNLPFISYLEDDEE